MSKKMFFQKIRWLILSIVAFVLGIIFTIQWIGTDYGMELYNLVKRPDVVEKIVEMEVVKIITISDNQEIQIINQEYREALLKISAVNYDRSSTESTYNSMKRYATKALGIPEKLHRIKDK